MEDDAPRKRVSKEEDEAPVQRVLPRSASNFRGGIYSRPNPMRFAQYAWAVPRVLDDSSEEDDKTPQTPDGVVPADVEVVTEESSVVSLFPPHAAPRAPLTFRPSPHTFAKNRWNGRLSSGAGCTTSSAVSERSVRSTKGDTGSLGYDGEVRTNSR